VLHTRSSRALVAAAATLTMLTGVAVAAPRAVAAPTVADVQKRVEQLNQQAEVASERYNTTREQLNSLTMRLDAAKNRLSAQSGLVQQYRRTLGQLAAESYKQGPLGGVSILFADDPQAYLASAGLTSTLEQRQANSVLRLTAAQKKLLADRATAQQQQAGMAKSFASLQADRAEVLKLLRLSQDELSQLKASQRAAVQQGVSSGGTHEPVAAGTSCASAGVVAPDARVKKVLDFACAQIGDPYQWAADGPGSWDCSGFTMMSWRQAGVSLPHSSSLQAGYGTRISTSELRAGDLVFYHSPISHVAIALGNGLMIDAPQTGDVVHIHALRDGITAAVRL
jgi:peptidoglycan DL-endopeptidase CwlO